MNSGSILSTHHIIFHWAIHKLNLQIKWTNYFCIQMEKLFTQHQQCVSMPPSSVYWRKYGRIRVLLTKPCAHSHWAIGFKNLCKWKPFVSNPRRIRAGVWASQKYYWHDCITFDPCETSFRCWPKRSAQKAFPPFLGHINFLHRWFWFRFFHVCFTHGSWGWQ